MSTLDSSIKESEHDHSRGMSIVFVILGVTSTKRFINKTITMVKLWYARRTSRHFFDRDAFALVVLVAFISFRLFLTSYFGRTPSTWTSFCLLLSLALCYADERILDSKQIFMKSKKRNRWIREELKNLSTSLFQHMFKHIFKIAWFRILFHTDVFREKIIWNEFSIFNGISM